MPMDYAKLFHTLQPGFFDSESIRSLPPEDVFEEQILDLHAFHAEAHDIPCPERITFGLYTGDIKTLRDAVGRVEDDWPEYFNEGDPVFCAFDEGKVVSFCLLDDFGSFEGLRIGAPGCVGTLPEYRKQGIGLKMVCLATATLKAMGYDLSYIHYTHVGHWYARLGYRTCLRWNAGGIIG